VRMTVLGREIDGRQLGRWVRSDQGDTSLVGKGRRPAPAPGWEDSMVAPDPQREHRASATVTTMAPGGDLRRGGTATRRPPVQPSSRSV
jgi:hypothetical protein